MIFRRNAAGPLTEAQEREVEAELEKLRKLLKLREIHRVTNAAQAEKVREEDVKWANKR